MIHISAGNICRRLDSAADCINCVTGYWGGHLAIL
jgi:hypothetical protein